jgi:hypothetical protein
MYFWDNIYFLLVYALKFTYLAAEKLLFFIILFSSMSVSFIGFNKLAAYFDKNIKKSSVFIISLWYCFNPYTLILWHTGNYTISLSLTYALAPLITYYLHTAMFSKFNFRNIIIFVLLLYFASAVFWLFASLLFFMTFYALIYLIMNKNQVLPFIRNLFTALLFYVPLVSFIAFNILYQLHNIAGDSNATFLPTYGSQLGGMIYQMLLYSSWAIYTPWYPRTLFSFAQYYFSPYYLCSMLFMYAIIAVGIIKYVFKRVYPFHQIINKIKRFAFNKQDKLLISTVLLYIISVFFAKASQPPFGEIFTYLYTHFSLFTVFRSADIRFGFLIILTISLLLLYLSKFYHKFFYLFSISLLIVVPNIYLLNGIAVFGENVKDKFYDRVTYYSQSQQQLSDFFNRFTEGSGYILTIPSVQFGLYNIDKNETFIGQDILTKNITMSSLYLLESKCTSQICSIYEKTNQQLLEALKSKDLTELNRFPIKYIVHRRDINCPGCFDISEKNLGKYLSKVFNNDLYTVYKMTAFTPIINAKKVSVLFTNSNPIRYDVELKNLKNKQDLNLLLSYNKDWKVYLGNKNNSINCNNGKVKYSTNISECVKPKIFFEGDELSYLWKKPLFENSQGLENGYANKWTIDPEYIKRNFPATDYTVNKDDSINIDLIIYFAPQSWLYLTFILSTSVLVSLIVYIVYKQFPKTKKLTKRK